VNQLCGSGTKEIDIDDEEYLKIEAMEIVAKSILSA